MELEVRSLIGRVERIAFQPWQTVGDLRKAIQSRWESKCILRLLLRVGVVNTDAYYLSKHEVCDGAFV